MQTGWAVIPNVPNSKVYSFGISLNSTNATVNLPSSVGIFWAIPAGNSSWEYGRIWRNASASNSSITYEAGVSSGGFTTLAAGQTLNYTKDAAFEVKTESYQTKGKTGSFVLVTPSTNTTTAKYWNVDKSMSLLVSTQRLDLVLSRTNLDGLAFKLGEPLKVHFITFEGVKVTSVHKIDITWQKNPRLPLELSLSGAMATSLGTIALLSSSFFLLS